MYIHKEGYKISIIAIVVALLIIGLMVECITSWHWFWYVILGVVIVFPAIIIRFFSYAKQSPCSKSKQSYFIC
jgi:MFS family permease